VRRFFGLIAAACGALALTAPATAATWRVDDDMQQCPGALPSINAAVVVAMPGDTILVCPGLYNETVQVPKTLTLRGSTPPFHGNRCLNEPAADPTKYSIVTGLAIHGFNLLANDIVLEGFVVRQTGGPAIQTSPIFSGYLVEKNVVENSTFGIYLQSSGVETTRVTGNCIRDNNQPGSASGNGIYSDAGLHDARIEHNWFTGHTSAAMVLAAGSGGVPPDQEDIVFAHNRLIDDSSIVLFGTTRAQIIHNYSLRHAGSGVFLGGANTDIKVAHNQLLQGGTGISVLNAFGAGNPNVDLVIERNRIAGGVGNGISLTGTSGHVVRYNSIERKAGPTSDGIRLNNANNNKLFKNHSNRNTSDGIHVLANSAGNWINGNHMSRNGEHDCHDDSVGPGTAGTANIWRKNHARTENRPGLCKKRGRG